MFVVMFVVAGGRACTPAVSAASLESARKVFPF